MKTLNYILILLLFINYSNATIQCKKTNDGNGTVCVSDESGKWQGATAGNGTPPPMSSDSGNESN